MNAIVPNAIVSEADTAKYARAIAASKAVRWDIDRDVIRGRRFDVAKKFLPDGLSLTQELALSPAEMRFISQIQVAPTPTSSAWSSVSSPPN